jgi:hypothetical protein
VAFDNEDHLVDLLAQPIEVVFGDSASRRLAAARIAEQHSFDQRAGVLIERAREIRDTR